MKTVYTLLAKKRHQNTLELAALSEELNRKEAAAENLRARILVLGTENEEINSLIERVPGYEVYEEQFMIQHKKKSLLDDLEGIKIEGAPSGFVIGGTSIKAGFTKNKTFTG